MTLILPKLEYEATVRSLSKKKRIKKAITKLLPSLNELSYEEILNIMSLTTLHRGAKEKI